MPRAALLLLAVVALAPALAAAVAQPAASTFAVSSSLAPATPTAAIATAPGVRLSEILFHPVAGEPGFVELLNAGPMDAPLDGLTLANERNQTFVLPSGLSPLAPGEVLLVVFDGGNRIEGTVLHATPADFLSLDSGAVELRGADATPLDDVAWGSGQADAVNLGRGGLSASPRELAPGTTIGRAPATVRRDPLDWTIFGPMEATPGTSNPQPGVSVLLPLPGTILDTPSANLRWYPIPGAKEYRVQLTAESDAGFAAPLVDVTVPEPSLLTDPLPPGRYLWRVQAIGERSEPAPFSPAQSLDFEVDPPSAQAPGGLRAMLAPFTQAARTKVLLVPLLAQRKDTRMLLIDRGVAESGTHAWDSVHPGTDMNDPADNMNCALAVAAMINAYSGGKLSQDRIGFEIRGGAAPGPEGDLNWGRGVPVDEFARVLAFALGVVPARFDVAGQGPDARDYFWQWVVDEIDAGRPLAVTVPGHAVVVSGYDIAGNGDRTLLIADPMGGQFSVVRLETIPVQSYYLTPLQVNARSDEPSIATDGDGDGVVDFDETERFGTDPADPDSDGDKVKDKQDILASVFDPTYGYANLGIGRPDYDGDAQEMERDKDSDDYGGATAGMGGCPDGMEDRNRDGKQNGAETSNFDPFDDRCLHARQVSDHTSLVTYGPDADGIWFEFSGGGHTVLEVWAMDVGEGRLEGTATYIGEFPNNIEREAPICGSQSWQHTQTVTGQNLTVSGTRQGDRVELTFHGEVRWTNEGTINGQGCATEPVAMDMTYEAAVIIPALAGELVEGRYEDEQVTDLPQPMQGILTIHTLIEQKGQDEAGAPVG